LVFITVSVEAQVQEDHRREDLTVGLEVVGLENLGHPLSVALA
jgi:hypothetical protein